MAVIQGKRLGLRRVKVDTAALARHFHDVRTRVISETWLDKSVLRKAARLLRSIRALGIRPMTRNAPNCSAILIYSKATP